MKIALIPLGCSKNTVDAERMLGRLFVRGHTLSPELFGADVVIVNTCGFIADAKQESIEHILQLAKAREHNSTMKIIVTGCLAQRYKEDIIKQLPEVDAVVTPGCNGEIADIIEKVLKGEGGVFTADINTMTEEGERVLLSPPHYSYLKIADGCNNRCSYCAIPLIRGSQRSKGFDSIVEEAKALAVSGSKELILVAQDTTAYKKEVSGNSELPQLLNALHDIDEIDCIRIMYAYPENIDDIIIKTMAKLPKVARYIDMPIQHISDSVLSNMRRRGGSKVIRDAIKGLKAAMPDIAIRTTVMVGFPGESEQDYNELLEFVKEGHFDHLGCFSFSKEEDTQAAQMKNQIPSSVKKKRHKEIMQAQYEVLHQKLLAKIGRVVGAYAENVCEKTGRTMLRDRFSAPEIDNYILVNENLPLYEIYEVQITGVEGYDLLGEVLED